MSQTDEANVEKLADELEENTYTYWSAETNFHEIDYRALARFVLAREQGTWKEATAAALGHAWMTVQKISDDYCNDPEHGGIDPETGVWEGTEAQQSYLETLDQAVEAIRALIPSEDSNLLAEVKRKERLLILKEVQDRVGVPPKAIADMEFILWLHHKILDESASAPQPEKQQPEKP
jgi:hypothetical protein